MRLVTGMCVCLVAVAAAVGAQGAGNQNASKAGELVLERPTIHCLGVEWRISGDANANATVALEYRKTGMLGWRKALPLLRVTGEAMTRKPAAGTTVFAGSILELEPQTEYEMRVTLSDPDGGGAQKAVKCRTRGEPVAPAPLRTLYVAPGTGGGEGTKQDPFRGLKEADAAARPGDLILVAKGNYPAPFTVTASGEPGRPVVWRAAGPGAVITGVAGAAKRPERGVSAAGVRDVWFEGLGVRDVEYGVVAHGSERIVVRRCHIFRVDYGFACTDKSDINRDFFLSDNVVEGPCTWPRTKGIENPRGFQISGSGHIVCYNRVRGFADGIDTFGTHETRETDVCRAIDVYGNEISEMTDDGIETDYSQQNCRFFRNRLTNCFQGISEQPVFGGPVYIFRNAIYNIEVEPFKMHTAGEPITSGFLIFHNTSVKQGLPWMVWTSVRVDNAMTRNNLFIGSQRVIEENTKPRAMDFSPKMTDCDFDYDGFGGGPFDTFAKWNGVVYQTLEEMQARAPVEGHAIEVDGTRTFDSGIQAPENVKKQYLVEKNDLRLRAGSKAVDAGVVIPSINDGFRGRAPDLGAYESGDTLPQYGPRPEAKSGPSDADKEFNRELRDGIIDYLGG